MSAIATGKEARFVRRDLRARRGDVHARLDNDSRGVYLTLQSHACTVGGHAAIDLNAVVVRTSTGTRTVPLDLPVHLSC